MSLLRTLVLISLFFILSNSSIAKQYKNGVELSSQGQIQRWESLPVKLCINKSVPVKYHQSIKNAVTSWNSNFIIPIFSINCVSSEDITKLEDSSTHSIYWESKSFNKFSSLTSLATTLRASDDKSGKFIDADIIVNSQSFNWNNGKLDLETVMLHELGHVLGIKHLFSELGSALNYYSYQSGYIQHEISDVDRMIVENIYFKGTNNVSLIDLTLNKKYSSAINLLKNKKKLLLQESYSLAYLFKLKKKFKKCKDQLLSLNLKNVPEQLNATLLLLRGECYWSMKDTKHAKKDFLSSLKYFPNYYEAKANLASIHLQKKNYKTAKKLFKEVLKINPVHYIACFHLNNLDAPTQNYRECVKRYSPDPSLVNLMKK